MIDSNRIIQGLWIGPKLSVMEQLSIRSFLAHGHEYHLYTYGSLDGVPAGTVIRDANEILPESRIFRGKPGTFGAGGVAAFADLFRFTLLHQRGGWWTDLDVICLRPFDHNQDNVICTSHEAEYGALACTFVLKLQAGGRVAEYCVQEATRKPPEEIEFGEIGPFLLQRMVKELAMESLLVPPHEFAPIGWRGLDKIVRKPTPWNLRTLYRWGYWKWREFRRPETRTGAITQQSYAIHLWNEFWRSSNIDKNATYSPHCEYEKLKRLYLGS